MLKSKNIKWRFLQSPASLSAGEGPDNYRERARLLFLIPYFLFSSCSVTQQISKQANTILILDSVISKGHIGISIYEPATNTYWYNYQAEKYFVPASNTKLFSLYAGMKYLGDSLIGLRYEIQNNRLNIIGTGDPTFLHPDFKYQPVFGFLKKSSNVSYSLEGAITDFKPFGFGWSWDDYISSDAAERSEMPMYGNVAKFYMRADTVAVIPFTFYNSSIQWNNTILKNGVGPWFDIVRPFENNEFHALNSTLRYKEKQKFSSQLIPFKTILNSTNDFKNRTFIKLLEDTLHKKVGNWSYVDATPILKYVIHSQPVDSLFTLMMHRSDNFFAEQTLLMTSNQLLGYMSDRKIIDTLLKTDLKDIPQKPRWVDGSGLSRYNLFTPQDFIYILQKLKNDFGFERLKIILPTGGTGTLSSLYKNDSGYIFAKTGTLSNHVALSGFLITKKNKFLIFSILPGNFIGSATPVRKAIEKFLSYIRQRY